MLEFFANRLPPCLWGIASNPLLNLPQFSISDNCCAQAGFEPDAQGRRDGPGGVGDRGMKKLEETDLRSQADQQIHIHRPEDRTPDVTYAFSRELASQITDHK